jgi:hypothetical protein
MPDRVRRGWPELLAASLFLSIAACGTVTRSVRGRGGADLVVRDFCQSLGRQKGLAILHQFVDTARVDIEGVSVSFVGREDIARLAEYGVAVHERLKATEIEAALDTVRCRLDESNDWLALLGVNRATYDSRFVVSRGRIDGARFVLTTASREELAGKLAGFLAWLLAQDPKALQRLLPGGRPAYDSRIVPELIGRLRQWRARPR